jgi:hypothetical protein
MFSSIFYKNKLTNNKFYEDNKKYMKESMDKYIRSLDEKYKKNKISNLINNSLIKKNNEFTEYPVIIVNNSLSRIFWLPIYIIYGFSFYQLSNFFRR